MTIAVDLGRWALLLSFVVSAYAIAASLVGVKSGSDRLTASGRNALLAVATLVTIAIGSLLYLLLARQFQVQYVWSTVSTYLPTVYVISALYAGQEGSLLFWLWLVSIFGAIVILRPRAWNRTLQPYVTAIVAGTQLLFAFILVFVSRPFALLAQAPAQGQGLNPLLENPGMIYHPPTLFLGYAAYAIPFAYAIASLASGHLGSEWIRRTRIWNLFAWLTLGVGILLGAQWAYVELGWGGYWAWDPVENSSLIPWLVGTAYVHSVMIQERRGVFKRWNIVLITLTYALCIFATFVTRSGLIKSVHAFERSPIGYIFLGFLAVILAITGWLLYYRRRSLEGPYEIESFASREATFLLTVLLFGGMALVVFIGTMFPSVAEMFTGTQVALGQSFFVRAFGPLAMALLLVLAVCPLMAWRRSSMQRVGNTLVVPGVVGIASAALAALLGVRLPVALFGFAVCVFVAASTLLDVSRAVAARHRMTREAVPVALARLVAKHRGRYGGYVVHLAIILVAMGVIGSSTYQVAREVSLSPGQSAELRGYTFQYHDYEISQTQAKERYVARLDVYQGNRMVATLSPERNYHFSVEQWVTEVAIQPGLVQDLYVSLSSLDSNGRAAFSLQLHPLVTWLWIGGGFLFLGALLAMWPAAESQRRGPERRAP